MFTSPRAALVKICAAIASSFICIANASAFNSTDESSINVKLGSDWKITNTQEKTNVAKLTEYSRNALGSDKEVIMETMLKKPSLGKPTDPIVKKLYASTKKLMEKNGCAYEDIKKIPQHAGLENEWGIFWQCAHNKRSGMMFFIDADPTTMYTFTYKADESYPLSPIIRNKMTEILKSIELCYKNKDCAALY